MIHDTDPTLHAHPHSDKSTPRLSARRGISALLFKPIIEDHLVNDLSAKDASPAEKLFTDTIEFLEDHCTTASMTLHFNLLKGNTLIRSSNFHTKIEISSGS